MSSAGTSRARFPISLAVGRRVARRQRNRLGRFVAVCGAVRSGRGGERCGPGGLKGRGVRGACASMPNGAAVRRARVQFSRLSAALFSRAVRRARISRLVRESEALSSSRKSSISGDSDRERVEGFQRSGFPAAAVAFAVAATTTRSERVAGFQLTGSSAVAVPIAATMTASERTRESQKQPQSPRVGPRTESRRTAGRPCRE
jgi:hypothetical protein